MRALHAFVMARIQCITRDHLVPHKYCSSDKRRNLQSNQGHESKIICSSGGHDIVNRTESLSARFPSEDLGHSLVEDRDRTSNTHNNQRLCSKSCKNNRAKNRSKQYFIDTITHIGLREPGPISKSPLLFSKKLTYPMRKPMQVEY